MGLPLGWFGGFAITRFKMRPFVATLGMFSIAPGLTMPWMGGFPATGWAPDSALLARTSHWARRYLYAVGGNERARLLTGLRANRIKLGFASGGGVAGLLVTPRQDSAQPSVGLGDELDSIAALVIGGTSLSGGSGSVLDTLLGCLICRRL